MRIDFFTRKLIWTVGFLLLTFFALDAQKRSINELPFVVEYSLDGGFYDESVEIELAASLPGSRIFYTLNGDEPSGRSARRYTNPLKIKKTTVIRAIARRGGKKSKTFAETYFIDEPASDFPVVSFAVPPRMLFDARDGLFVQGERAIDSVSWKPGANFWSRVEIPVHTQFFEPDGKSVFNSRTGFRLFGGMSRLFPQKSFTIVARNRYGKKSIKHPVFGEKGLKKFKYLVFRNSGSDFGKAHFRDAYMQSLTEGWDLESQDYRSSHVYINGEYWGIYNIREKINRHFIDKHTGVDKDSVSILEHRYKLKQGSKKHYVRMIKYMLDHSLSSDYRFAHVNGMMDTENFMDYKIAQIYFDNSDAGGNIKFWRPNEPGGRWRWLLYDTDWGFGLHNKNAYRYNSLQFHTKPDGPKWPNPPWSTFILRELLENETFEQKFINRMCDRLNTSFSSGHALGKLEDFHKQLKPEIQRQLDRWNLSISEWNVHLERIREFAEKRPKYVRKHLAKKFDTGREVSVMVEATQGGRLVINETVDVFTEPMTGIYFEKVPIYVRAVPHFGYRFSHWEGIDVSDEARNFSLQLTDSSYRFKAVFEKYDHPLAGKIIINEISCNNKKSKDWLELYNLSDEPVKLRDWVLTDKKHEFRLDDVTIMPKDYAIFSEDSSAFFKVHPKAYSVAGSFDFGLDKRNEIIGLFSEDGAFIDSVSYDLLPSDSAFTLNLLLPWLDNSDSDNWEIRKGIGSPNSANQFYVESRIQARNRMWLEIGGAIGIILLCFLALYFRREGIL